MEEGERLWCSTNIVVLCKALLIVSKFNSLPTTPSSLYAPFYYLSHLLQCRVCSYCGFVNEVFVTKVIEISPWDPLG